MTSSHVFIGMKLPHHRDNCCTENSLEKIVHHQQYISGLSDYESELGHTSHIVFDIWLFCQCFHAL